MPPSATPPDGTPPLHLNLFGGLRALRGGVECRLTSPLGQHILAYLALHPGRQPREVIAEALWPELPPGQGRRHLSDHLYQIKKSLGSDWVSSDTDRLALNEELVQVDLWQFERLLRNGSEEALQEAVQLYRGDLLPGFYDEWVLTRRLAARESYLEALKRLGQLLLKSGRPDRAIIPFQRLVREDPLREAAVRGLMRALAASDRIPQALKAYTELEASLQVELEAAPSEDTRQVVRQLEAELSARQQFDPERSDTPPMVGRTRERSSALALVERALGGSGGALAFEGPPGIGKTRLLREIANGSRWRGAAVAWGTASEGSDLPYGALAEALQSTLDSLGATAIQRLLPRTTLAALSPLRPEWADRAALPELPPDLAFARLTSALADAWTAIATVEPLVLVLDDMHWARPDQWRALEPLLSRLSESSLMLLLAYRRTEAQHGDGWRSLLEWERAGQIEVHPLAPLTAEDVTRLLPPRRAGEAERLVQATGGIPLYLMEALVDSTRTPGEANPWRARAAELPQTSRRALQAAAVLVEELSFDNWQAVSGLDDDPLAKAAVSLVQRGFLQPEGAKYKFTHDLIRRTVYRLIPSQEARALHKRAAEVLQRQPEASLERTARHLALAGQDREAAEHYLQAGVRSLERHATAQAAEHFGAGLELAPSGAAELRYELASQQARALEFDPEPEARRAALAAAQQAAEQLHDPGRQVEVQLGLRDLHAREGDIDAATSALERAQSLNAELKNPHLDLRIESARAELALRLGDPKAASVAFRRAAEQAEQLGQLTAQGRALDGLAFCMASLGATFEQISGHFKQALKVFRQQEDRFNEARTLLNYFSACQNAGAWEQMETMAPEVFAALEEVDYGLGEGIAHQAYGLAACYQGDFEAADRHLGEAADRFRNSGDPLAVSLATTGLGQVLRRRGDLRAAEDRLREARRLAEGAQARIGVAFAEQELAVLLIETGRYGEARHLLTSAITAWKSAGDPGNLSVCRAALGLCWLKLGDREQAGQAASELAAELPPPDEPIEGEEPQVALWLLYRLLAGLGQEAQATSVLERAAGELNHQVQRLSKLEARRRMLLDVPTNRRVALGWLQARGVRTHAEVDLAAADAPLGRPLQQEERVRVKWTLVSPEDETISDPVSRRRHALRRLLDEAERADAAPTDSDLAQALNVSRRTILRDMKALKQDGHLPATRRRSPR